MVVNKQNFLCSGSNPDRIAAHKKTIIPKC